jgi:hypothetical protein
MDTPQNAADTGTRLARCAPRGGERFGARTRRRRGFRHRRETIERERRIGRRRPVARRRVKRRSVRERVVVRAEPRGGALPQMWHSFRRDARRRDRRRERANTKVTSQRHTTTHSCAFFFVPTKRVSMPLGTPPLAPRHFRARSAYARSPTTPQVRFARRGITFTSRSSRARFGARARERSRRPRRASRCIHAPVVRTARVGFPLVARALERRGRGAARARRAL